MGQSAKCGRFWGDLIGADTTDWGRKRGRFQKCWSKNRKIWARSWKSATEVIFSPALVSPFSFGAGLCLCPKSHWAPCYISQTGSWLTQGATGPWPPPPSHYLNITPVAAHNNKLISLCFLYIRTVEVSAYSTSSAERGPWLRQSIHSKILK